MREYEPFVLLDDARATGASDAQLFENPRETFVAYRPEDVPAMLDAADAARQAGGGTLAGYMAYEAGLALEERLVPLAGARSGAAGPLLWFGLFDGARAIRAEEVPEWLEQRGGTDRASIGPLDPQVSTGAYLDAFDRLQEAIRAGDIYQANLTFPLAGPAYGDPLAIYRAIRPAAAAGYGGVIFDGSHWLLSFSPELFVTLRGVAAKVKPMKGTRPRGRDAAEDAALADELAGSVKDKAENLMIVDLLRNDLSRVSDPGSVRVDQPFAVETYPTVHQMVSTVRAELRDGMGAMDVIRALFPCGSITGAPKIRAMELIHQVERDARGPYCGAIGRIGTDGEGGTDAAFNVAIRTVRLIPDENLRYEAVLGVGGAIVADSIGMEEWRECLIKADFARGHASGADLIETMRVDPEQGIPLLELHLERLRDSAVALGFAFDRHEARNRIQALCFELEGPAKLRLVLSRGGEMALDAASLPNALEQAQCIVLPLPVVPGDWRLRHKSTDRHFYAEGLELAHGGGAHETLFIRDDGLLTEGCWTSLFVERAGKLVTPRLDLGLLPGVLRRSLLEQGRAMEGEVRMDDLGDGFFVGNAVRGLIPARLAS